MMASKRIQKYLIDRDDTMYYSTGFERIYVNTYNGLDDINFVVTFYAVDVVGDNKLATFYYDSPLAVELAMRLAMPDLRKWRVLKNGQ